MFDVLLVEDDELIREATRLTLKQNGYRVRAAAADGLAGLALTGDRVIVDAKGKAVDAKGKAVGVERTKGRENVPVQVRQSGGHTIVVPLDAARPPPPEP
ncbi:hypothetical protein OK074_5313 [Actinobacteria bacterium OK074]|nr:hypothetical protein OK074_5313 [Actinobacteria bacterium OK074]